MRSNYKKIGEYIRQVNNRNKDLVVSNLLGINIDKFFMPSVANIVGTDMSNYKIVKKWQFACNRMHVWRDMRLPVALSHIDEDFIVSPAYDVFEIIDEEKLLPEYLMMWFSRQEFDRNAWFYTDADVRQWLHWDAFCNMELPVPDPIKQQEIVDEYNTIKNRISLNNSLIGKLEETAQAVYREWFVDGIDMENLPSGWEVKNIRYLVQDTKWWDWWKSEKIGNYSEEVICIRWTDIPNFQLWQFWDAPKRFIPKKNCTEKSLENWSIVVEISWWSPTQSTWRSTLITKEHLNNWKYPIICSNFCKVIRLKNLQYCYFLFAFIDYLYKSDILFNYENSTIWLKNFDLEWFLDQQDLVIPSENILESYNKIYTTILKNIFTIWKENENLWKMKDLILSKMASEG